MSKEAIAPIDESVPIPASVKAASARAEAAHKAAYNTPDPQPAPAAVTPPPAEPVTPPVAPAPAPGENPLETGTSPVGEPVSPPAPVAHPVEPVTVEQWEHRYLSMKGRFEQSQQSLGAMQQQLAEMSDELIRMQTVLTQRAPGSTQAPTAPTKILTDEERKTYGEDLISTMQKAALEAVAPEIQAVRQENQQLRQRVAQSTNSNMVADLAAAVPNWQEIKENPRFHTWLRLPDVYSGAVRLNLLKAAFQAASAPRVIAFYKGFLAEEQATGQLPVPQPQPLTAPRVAAVPLESLTAPGKARPATGDTGVPAEKPIYTHAQVAGFYAAVRQQRFVGREAEKATIEADIIAAGREGRIR